MSLVKKQLKDVSAFLSFVSSFQGTSGFYGQAATAEPYFWRKNAPLGDVLLSQDPAVQVPSALEGLTVVFGMGTRGSPPPSPPNDVA